VLREVARVDQDVAVGDFRLIVKPVRVADADNGEHDEFGTSRCERITE